MDEILSVLNKNYYPTGKVAHDPQCFGRVDSKMICEGHRYTKVECEVFKCCDFDDSSKECKGESSLISFSKLHISRLRKS